MTPPIVSPYSVQAVDGGTLIVHEGDPKAAADWVRRTIWSALATAELRRTYPPGAVPKYDVDPLMTQLRQIRLDRGLSAADVGNVMGTGRARLREYEIGQVKPRADVLRAWTYVLGQDLALVPR